MATKTRNTVKRDEPPTKTKETAKVLAEQHRKKVQRTSKNKLTAREREKAIEEISVSMNKVMGKRFREILAKNEIKAGEHKVKKNQITTKDRDRAIKEISASIDKSFSEKYLKDWLK